MTKNSLLSARIDRRKLIVATSGAVIAAPFLSAALPAAAQVDGKDLTVSIVTDTAGIGDQGFNDLAKKGGDEAVAKYGVTLKVIESQTAADYEPNLTQGAEGGQLTIATGFLLTEALTNISQQYPDKDFMMIDSVVEGDNIASVTFKEQEGSFLAGVLAALTTKTGKVGFVGGQRIPPVIHYEVGFVAGAKSVNPSIDVQISYADSFEDPATGKELALAQYNKGADVLQQAAGRTGVGLYDAVKEKGSGFWVISGDDDQAHLGPDFQLAAVAKVIDGAVLRVVDQVVDGSFKGGVQNLGLSDGGMDLIAFHKSVTAETKATIAKYKAAIIAGTVVPPTDDDSAKKFVPVSPDSLPAASPAASPAA